MTVISEETTTLPEGAVISLYRAKREKGGSEFTQMVAFHAENRVEMRMDNVPAHRLKDYLRLCVREIERQRAMLTSRPNWELPPRRPDTIKLFVQTMAYYKMFLLQAWNEATNPEAVLQGSKQIPNETGSGRSNASGDTVRKDGKGTKRRSGKAKADRRRRKRSDVGVQPDAIRHAQGQEDGGRAEGVPDMVDETESRSGSDPAGNPARGVCEQSDSDQKAADVGLPEDPPF